MSRRQKARAARVQEFWHSKYVAADSPAKRVAVVWDYLRATIDAVPSARQPAVWERLEGSLDDFRREVTESEINTSNQH